MVKDENGGVLIFPKEVKWDTLTLSDTFGTLIAEPYERGYGHTIGNALRRVLLSSLEGCAIACCRIDGAQHEFQTLPGVVEDVLRILMNLKKIRFKMLGPGPETIRLKRAKPGPVTAAAFEENPNLKILTPEAPICTLESGGELEMEAEVRRGRGYVSAEGNVREGDPAGTLHLDSIFSPVWKVHYEVESARVGQRTDYDRLVLSLWTDGSIHPQDAVAYAAKILKERMDIFLVGATAAEIASEVPAGVADERRQELMNQPIDLIEFSQRALNCLKAAKIETIGDLLSKSELELTNYPNLGEKTLEEIRERLGQIGLHLRKE